MSIQKRSGGEVVVSLPTEANQSLGAFVIFSGVVATPFAWYLFSTWFGHVPRTRADWLPGAALGGALVTIGLLLAFASRKRVRITPTAVHVWDGLLRRPLTFRWTAPPLVRLQRLDSQSVERARTRWMVKLISERHEYTLDDRLDRLLQSRMLAEAVSRTLDAALMEDQEDNATITIEASDLDLPFCRRAQKYPNLLGSPVEKPESTPIQASNEGSAAHYSCCSTTGLMVDVAGVGLAFALLSAVPFRRDGFSLLEQSIRAHNFSLYYWLVGSIGGFAALVSGFRVQLVLTPERVTLRESLWGVPISKRQIPLGEIEEVQVHRSVRGPLIQIISDQALIQFRVGNQEAARWLGYEIRRFLMERGPCSTPPPGAPAASGPG